jgi:hypothetical protein
MKNALTAIALLCLAAAPAAAGGMNFSWNTSKQCAVVQTGNWDFDCDNNDTVMYMVASFKPNFALVGLNALDARIDGQTEGAIPAWWQGYNPGSCREAAFTPGVIDVDPTAPCAGSAATRLWTTPVWGGMGLWAYDSPGRFHTVVGFATVAYRAANLSTATQYNAFHIAVATTNTVHVAPDPAHGIDEVLACDGCCRGMTLELSQIGLYGSAAQDQLYYPMTTPYGTTIITYQGGGAGRCTVPVRNTTWGQLKGMYR